MLVTAWNNGKYHTSGAGYGFKLTAEDRDRYFDRSWESVTVVLPGGQEVATNIAKDSFWGNCRELISKNIGVWLIDNNHTPWPKGFPPKFNLTPKRGKFVLSTIE